jgi:hypothetical protein
VNQADQADDILSTYRANAGGARGQSNGSASVSARSDSGVGRPPGRESLVDLLDRVLDKGVVIAGDISISLLDIELLTIKVRLLIASVDKAREMGIDWWNHDPQLSSAARRDQKKLDADQEARRLRDRVAELESRLNALLDEQNEREPGPASVLAAPHPGKDQVARNTSAPRPERAGPGGQTRLKR